MDLRSAALIIAATGALLLVAACGGGGGGDGGGGGNSPSPTSQSPQSPSSDSAGNGAGSSSTGNSAPGGSSSANAGGGSLSGNCAPTETTVVGGPLFAAAQGLIGASLLSNHGFEVQLGYSTCDGDCRTQQHQDAFAFAFGLAPPLFSPQAAIGTTLQLQPQGSVPINGQTVSTFPKGTPIFLVFGNGDERSTTANNKDLGRAIPESAVVTYGTDNTAAVNFHSSTGFDIRVGLTNVRGDLKPGCSI